MNKNNEMKNRRNTLLVVIVTAFMTTVNSSSLNLSIPGISAEFGVSAQTIGWLVTLYSLCSVSLALPFGKIADVTSRVKIMRCGILIFAVGVCLGGFAWNFSSLLIFRFLQGVGSSMIFATSTAVLIAAFKPEERGRIIGYSVCATYIGLSSGPVIGGLINGYFGWRTVMYVTAAVSVMVMLIAFTKLPDNQGKAEVHKLDYTALILYSTGIAMLMYGLSEIGVGYIGYVLVAAGIITMALFVKRELRYEREGLEPVLKISLFKRKNFSYSNLAALMNYAATYAVSYYMSIYLQLVRGYSSQLAGLILISAPLMQAVLSPWAGRQSDKHSPYKLSSAGMGCCAASLLLLAFVGESTPLYFIVPVLALLGLGFALFSSPNTNAIMSSVEPEDSGIASSIVATMRNCGQTTSMAIITVIVGITMGNVSINHAGSALIVTTMHWIFIVFSVVCVVGIFLSLRRK